MKHRILHEIAGFTIALASIAAAVALRLLLDPILGSNVALITLYGAVAVTVWFGGFRYAALAALLGYLACDYLFMAPRGHFFLPSPTNIASLILYRRRMGRPSVSRWHF